MMRELHRLNTRLMISIWPNMNPGGDNWREMRDQGCLLGNQGTYDAFQEKARELYWKHANEGLFAHGIDAWWCDCTEPFQTDWTGAIKPEPEERLRINTEEAKRYLDPEYINAYSLLHSQGIYEGQRRVIRGQARRQPDSFCLCRAAALQHDHVVGRRFRDLGHPSPSDRRWAEFLRDRLTLLDGRYWRILRQK